MSDEAPEPTPGLTKVTLYLVPSAVEALGATVERTGETNTITINRAIQVYRHVLGLTLGERMTFEERDEVVALLRVAPPDPDAAISPPSQPESGSLALEVPEEASGTLGVAQGRRRAARLLRSAARNINGMHPNVAQQWLLSTADIFEKAAVEAAQQPAEDS